MVIGDTTLSNSFGCDHGIAAQTIMLAATEAGLGGCMVASIDRDGLRGALGIPPHLEILLVLALGTPREIVMLEPLKDGDVKYWRDEAGRHHVPKRALTEVLLRSASLPGAGTP